MCEVAEDEQNLVGGIRRGCSEADRTSRCSKVDASATQIYPVFRDLFKKEPHERQP